MDETSRHRRSRLALAALMVVTGLLHFVVPEPYVRIIPRFLREDWARPLVYASGVAEVAGGLALVPRRTRRPAAWFVTVLLILVFPANVQMALDAPGPLTVGRLPLQAPLIWWAWRQSRGPIQRTTPARPASTGTGFSRPGSAGSARPRSS